MGISVEWMVNQMTTEFQSDGPQINNGSSYDSLTLWWCESTTHSIERVFHISDCDIFLS